MSKTNCSSCFTGCDKVQSDKCVMYTGGDVPILGIEKGDSLSYIQQALITFLTSTLNGAGIKLDIADEIYCELVSQYLQECDEVSALDLFKALIQAACSLQEQVSDNKEKLDELNADYTIGCLEDVTASSDTHDIVQAVITKLCSVDVELVALATDIDTNYVKISELNAYIAAYIASIPASTKYSSRMIPYSILPYYGSLSPFDATGAGLSGTDWEDIYLCNGENSTPDLRGYTLVGTIASVPGNAMDPRVNPASSSFNPNYSLGTPEGNNRITLTEAQIPAHTHTAVSSGSHSHTVEALATTDSASGALVGGTPTSLDGEATTSIDGSHTHIINSTGGGQPHSNIQPVFPVYFIIYIP